MAAFLLLSLLLHLVYVALLVGVAGWVLWRMGVLVFVRVPPDQD